MYHSIVLEDLLDIIYLIKIYKLTNLESLLIIESLKDLTKGMLFWLDKMSHPDGELSFFNDTALGISSNYKTLIQYANRIFGNEINKRSSIIETKSNNIHLYDSGFIISDFKNCKFIADVGDIKSRNQPAHSHAEILSFELSLYGSRVFVNSGISTYNNNFTRKFQRSSEAHNTLTVNNENSSEVWHSFRLGNHAKPKNLNLINKSFIKLSCSHDGYSKKYNLIHERIWELRENKLIISDYVNLLRNDIKINYYLHPNINIRKDKNLLVLSRDKLEIAKLSFNDCKYEIKNSYWYPTFNRKVANKKIIMYPLGHSCALTISW